MPAKGDKGGTVLAVHFTKGGLSTLVLYCSSKVEFLSYKGEWVAIEEI